jgi:hypothetical protein
MSVHSLPDRGHRGVRCCECNVPITYAEALHRGVCERCWNAGKRALSQIVGRRRGPLGRNGWRVGVDA